MDNVARGEKARRIAHSYVGWSVGAGLIPFPLVDVGSLVVLQVKMLTEIAEVYGVPLQRERARTLVMSTAGALAPQGVALAGIPTLLKFVPILGTLLGIAVMPAAAATSTLALAELFIHHIETHGKVPDRALPQITHSQAELPTTTEVIDEPAVPKPTSMEEPPTDTPTADSAPATPPPPAEVVINELVVPEPAPIEEPHAVPPAAEAQAEEPTTTEPAVTVPADDHPSAAASEHDAQSEPEAASDEAEPPDADTEQPARRRQPSARTRRRSPSTETS